MAASSEIRFRIGADTSSFSRSMIQLETIAETAGKAVERKFSMKDAFKGAMIALGLQIEKVSDKVAEMFTGGSQEAWKSALEAAKDAARTIEESTLKRMSTARQIVQLEKEIKRLQSDADPTPRKTSERVTPRKVIDQIGQAIFTGGAALFGKIGAKTAAASMGRAAGMLKERGEENSVETEAEAAERSQKANAEILAQQERQRELEEQQVKNRYRIEDAQRELSREGLTGAEKVNAAIEDEFIAEERLNEAKKKGQETTELELDMLAKAKAVRTALGDEQKEIDERHKQYLELEKQSDERHTQLLERQTEARHEQENNFRDLGRAQHDQVAFSLDDAVTGTRGNSGDRARARQIQRLEKRARGLYDNNSTVMDPTGQFEISAEMMQGRANKLRGQFERLNTSDRDPFKALTDKIEEGNKHLEKIASELESTEGD